MVRDHGCEAPIHGPRRRVSSTDPLPSMGVFSPVPTRRSTHERFQPYGARTGHRPHRRGLRDVPDRPRPDLDRTVRRRIRRGHPRRDQGRRVPRHVVRRGPRRHRGVLRLRPHLGRPLQPGGHARPRRRRPLPVAEGHRLRHRADRRRGHRDDDHRARSGSPVPRAGSRPRRMPASPPTAGATTPRRGFGFGGRDHRRAPLHGAARHRLPRRHHPTRGTPARRRSRSGSP